MAAPAITVNLAPAALRKEGAGFDLSIALAVLAASAQVPASASRSTRASASSGSTAASGRSRADRSRRRRAVRVSRVICAAESAPEAALAGVEASVSALAEAVGYLRGHDVAPTGRRTRAPFVALPDLAEVRGQERGRRALELAAAGSHNLLLAGPPGTGKTMLARRLPSILPPLTREEALEVTRIHSVAGTLSQRPGSSTPAVPRASPRGVGGGGRRWRVRPAPR